MTGKCLYHDRLERKIDRLCDLTAQTREDVAFLRGRVRESGLTLKIVGLLIGLLVTVGGGIAWLLSRAG